jgi:carboxylate-amine ligase
MRTVGVEEELLLIDEQTWTPAPLADRVLRWRGNLQGSRAPEALTGEMQLEMIEAVSSPHRRMSSLRDEVTANRAMADAIAALEGGRVAALASSPMTTAAHARSSDRYDTMMRRYGALPKHTLSCGLHVHVAIESEEEGVAVLDRIRVWTPLLIALSANSPFHDGEDTGHASFRTIDWSRWPSSGPVDPYGSVARYRSVERSMLATGALLDPAMLYFDARLSRAYPTVEVRVADVPMDVRTTVTIAALVRALVDTAARDWRNGAPAPDVPACTLRLAKWRAALEGLNGELVDPLAWEAAPARDVLAMLLAHVTPALHANGDDQAVEHGLAQLLKDGSGADMQRADYQPSQDLCHVVRAAVARTNADNTQSEPPDSTATAAEPGPGDRSSRISA